MRACVLVSLGSSWWMSQQRRFGEICYFLPLPLLFTPPNLHPSSPLHDIYFPSTAGFGTVLALRVHHSLGDGMSLVAVSRSVLEAAGGGKLGMGLSASGGNGGGSSAADAVVKPANRGLSSFSMAKVGLCDLLFCALV